MSNQRFSLRDYQKEAIQNVIRARQAGHNRLLVCLPTGAGKTVTFVAMTLRRKEATLILVNTLELADQTIGAFVKFTNFLKISNLLGIFLRSPFSITMDEFTIFISLLFDTLSKFTIPE